MKHKAARARSRLDELTFDTFNVCTAAVNGVNSIGHVEILLRPYAARCCGFIGLQKTRPNGTELPKSSHLNTVFI